MATTLSPVNQMPASHPASATESYTTPAQIQEAFINLLFGAEGIFGSQISSTQQDKTRTSIISLTRENNVGKAMSLADEINDLLEQMKQNSGVEIQSRRYDEAQGKSPDTTPVMFIAKMANQGIIDLNRIDADTSTLSPEALKLEQYDDTQKYVAGFTSKYREEAAHFQPRYSSTTPLADDNGQTQVSEQQQAAVTSSESGVKQAEKGIKELEVSKQQLKNSIDQARQAENRRE
ncbi:MAG: hypothetical protein ACPGUD_13135 [Parashewanella sp.]